MTKGGISMIFLPESIERILERIGEAYKRDIKNTGLIILLFLKMEKNTQEPIL